MPLNCCGELHPRARITRSFGPAWRTVCWPESMGGPPESDNTGLDFPMGKLGVLNPPELLLVPMGNLAVGIRKLGVGICRDGMSCGGGISCGGGGRSI